MAPEHLRHWRGNISQREAAHILGVHLRTYENWEAGRTRIPAAVDYQCAALVLGVGRYSEVVK